MKILKFNKTLKKKIKSKKNSSETKNFNMKLNFNFPSAVKIIKEAPSSNFLIAYGNYPPQIKCFDLENLCLKFQRNLDADIIDFQFLGSNWEKLVLLRSDKFLEFHTKSGRYYQIKLDKMAVDLSFSEKHGIIFIPSSENEILRLDLEKGKFLSSLKNFSKFNNTCSGTNSFDNLFAVGNSGGVVKFWDMRIVKKFVFKIENYLLSNKNFFNSVSTLRFGERNNFSFYFGLNSGELIQFDLRKTKPINIKNFGNKIPIKSIRMTNLDDRILTSDNKMIKIWEKNLKKNFLLFESKHQINHICKIKKTGFFFIACEYPFIEGKFTENLGKIPNWCPKINL
jgi:ribosome biogenesis protein ENP2